jgi:hypothetical protein
MLCAMPVRADAAAARSRDPSCSRHGLAVIAMLNLMWSWSVIRRWASQENGGQPRTGEVIARGRQLGTSTCD